MKTKETEFVPDRVTKMAVELARAMAERSQMNKELSIGLANALAANERTQRRFKYAVIEKLARMEVVLQLVRVAQMARDPRPFHFYQEKLERDAKAAEDYISRARYESGLAMVKYIYATEGEVEIPERGRRKWSGWEI